MAIEDHALFTSMGSESDSQTSDAKDTYSKTRSISSGGSILLGFFARDDVAKWTRDPRPTN